MNYIERYQYAWKAYKKRRLKNNSNKELAEALEKVEEAFKAVEGIPTIPLVSEERLLEILPSGSGINLRWLFTEYSTYFKCKNAYHCMNKDGQYVGWAEFSITIPKTNPSDFKLHFHGAKSARLNNQYYLREYLEHGIAGAISKLKVG